jgi:2-C-methyl-D-erythritol 4-phosphate cytidylyltransferase/2-C-methyl-D-erythritol 2,4-cyclodiphosphate synthase
MPPFDPLTSFPRTGFGFDSHSFSAAGTLVLGGLSFAGTPALKGHSDGDALLHAVIDALLGAAVLGDIGELFPDTDARFKGADSRRLLAAAMERVRDAGFVPAHVDVTVVAEHPRLAPRKAELRAALAGLLGLPTDRVSVKGKTPEGLTLFAPPGGVAVWAVATVVPAR